MNTSRAFSDIDGVHYNNSSDRNGSKQIVNVKIDLDDKNQSEVDIYGYK